MIKHRLAMNSSRISWVLAFGIFLIPDTSSAQAQNKKKEIPAPVVITTVARDGVEVRAEFYPGTNEKESVPVILVHDWAGNRGHLLDLAAFLQKTHGCAVIVPDLRGHGDSLTVQNVEKQLSYKKFRKGDIDTMVNDVDACRKFLQDKNNSGELNIDMLTVVGVGKMCPVVVNWSVMDWQWPALGGIKQGQNVKAVVMISPERRFKSVSMNLGLKTVLFSGGGSDVLSVLLVWGSRNSGSTKEGKDIYESMKRRRPKTQGKNGSEQWWDTKSLFSAPYSTSKKGIGLLEEKQSGVFPAIGNFIDKKIIARQDEFRWQNRSRK